MEKADTILICGAMANTFFKAQGIPIGSSRVEADKLDLADELLALAKKARRKLLLPVDALECARDSSRARPAGNTGRLTPDHGIPDGWQVGRYRAGNDRAFRGRDRESENNFLEWAARDFRNSGLRRGHFRDRARRWRDRMRRPSSAVAIRSPRSSRRDWPTK